MTQLENPDPTAGHLGHPGHPGHPGRLRRLRSWLIAAIFCLLLLGVFASGYFFDEPPPDVRDLALAEPAVGAIDPFARFEAEPPVGRGEIAEILFNAGFRVDPAGDDPAAELAADAEIAELRKSLREWFTRFEREFDQHGGNPRRATIEEQFQPVVDLARPLRPTGVPDEALPPKPNPFIFHTPVHLLLLEAALLESSVHDFDQAFTYAALAFDVEVFRMSYASFFEPDGLEEILDDVTRQIEEGELARVADRKVFDRLLAWELPTSVFAAMSAEHFEEMVREIEEPELIEYLSEGEGFGFRFKKHRTLRRFADLVRATRADPLATAPIAPAKTLTPVRLWIDPWGDEVLEILLEDGLGELRSRFCHDWQRVQFVRLAVAIHRFEQEKGTSLERLEQLVPDVIPAIPHFPISGRQPAFDPASRQLTSRFEWDEFSIEIPRRREEPGEGAPRER